MNVTDAGRALRRRWLAILLALIVGTGAGVIGAVLVPTQYTAKATLFVSSPPSADASASVFDREQVAVDRTKSYALLVDDPRVLDQAIARYRLPTTRVALADHVLVSNPYDSTLIDVEAIGRTPGEAAAFANAVGETFSTSAATIGAGTGAGPAVTVSMIQPATLPDDPSSPRKATTILVGLLIGLVVGLGYALIREALDRSVRTADGLRGRSGLPVLATTERDRYAARRPIVVASDPGSHLAEAYRRLRTTLRMSNRADGTVLLVAGPSGAGRTTVALNLAAATASVGSRVLFVDADLRHPEGAVQAGVESWATGLTEVLAGTVGLNESIRRHEAAGLDVLPAGAAVRSPGELLATGGMVELLAGLRRRYDVIVLDSSALGPVADAATIASQSDGVLLVCRHGRSTGDQIDETLGLLASVSAPVVGTVLTAVPRSRSRGRTPYFDAAEETRPRAITAGPSAGPNAESPAHPGALEPARRPVPADPRDQARSPFELAPSNHNGNHNGNGDPSAEHSALHSPTVNFGTQWWFGNPPDRSR